MSNNRLYYDTCEVKAQLKEALRPGEYQVGTPVIEKCYPTDPSIRLQKTGNSVSLQHTLVMFILNYGVLLEKIVVVQLINTIPVNLISCIRTKLCYLKV